MINILVFLLGLSLLITIHELGHFIVAKIFGVYCHEFSIGMGPAIFSKKKGETKYSVRWLPIGGYVSMAGEEVNSEKEEVPIDEQVTEEPKNDGNDKEEMPDIPYERTINGIKAWKRFLVIGAGVFMNFILAYILFFLYILSVGVADTTPRLNVNYTSAESEVYAFKEANIPEGVLLVDSVDNKIIYDSFVLDHVNSHICKEIVSRSRPDDSITRQKRYSLLLFIVAFVYEILYRAHSCLLASVRHGKSVSLAALGECNTELSVLELSSDRSDLLASLVADKYLVCTGILCKLRCHRSDGRTGKVLESLLQIRHIRAELRVAVKVIGQNEPELLALSRYRYLLALLNLVFCSLVCHIGCASSVILIILARKERQHQERKADNCDHSLCHIVLHALTSHGFPRLYPFLPRSPSLPPRQAFAP